MNPMLANAGVPMIMVQMPLMVCALIPIIFIEGHFVAKEAKLPRWPAIRKTAIANLVSTFVGIPIAWFFMLLVNLMVTGGAGGLSGSPPMRFIGLIAASSWLAPYGAALSWIIPFAMMILLIPSLIVSIYSEYWVFVRLQKDIDRGLAKRIFRKVNFITYGILFLLNCIWLATGIYSMPKSEEDAKSTVGVMDEEPRSNVVFELRIEPWYHTNHPAGMT